MKSNVKKGLGVGACLVLVFILWTILIQHVDLQPVGQNGTGVGFATLNVWFHQLTGVHMAVYNVTDWLGLVPFLVCAAFGCLGLYQLVKRKSLMKADPDILLLGGYYILVILAYLFFEMVPINYRPIPIDGVMEASYPSSTALLVLSVMPTLKFQVDRRSDNETVKKLTTVFVLLFSAFMVIGRLISGVHWLTDIVGAVFLSTGLFLLYRSLVALVEDR